MLLLHRTPGSVPAFPLFPTCLNLPQKPHLGFIHSTIPRFSIPSRDDLFISACPALAGIITRSRFQSLGSLPAPDPRPEWFLRPDSSEIPRNWSFFFPKKKRSFAPKKFLAPKIFLPFYPIENRFDL